ncbi:MAG: site-specific integrase [Campylobacterales bacterium]|nr:site-specific integrase [Campylobacterales bacterium]
MRPRGTTRAKKPILKKEYDRLIAAVYRSLDLQSGTKMKLISAFTLLYLTGCRVSEIVEFCAKDVEQMIAHNEFSLTNRTKTRKSRLISFDSDRVQVEFLKKILPLDGGPLFKRNNSNTPMTASALKFMMNSFIHKILGELYSTHSFRAGYITAAHQLGQSLEHIRQDVGHKDIATTARYAIVTSEEISRGKNLRTW